MSRSPGSSTSARAAARRSRHRRKAARSRRSRSAAASSRPTSSSCPVARSPNYKLLAQAGARVEYDESRGIFVPTDLPDHVEAVGAVTGDVGAPAVPSPILDHRGDKCFVCLCEDQTTKDLKYAIAEGFDSIELSKRYTTVTMGPCQGRLCHTNSIRVYAKTTGLDENTIGTTTARPPYTPISMGLLAGPPQEPRKRTSLHHRHKDMGGTMMWTGAWRRPHSYGHDAAAEAQHVHQALGLIDVSTLGKILVTGPDAGAFLDRVYPNRFSDLEGRANALRRAHRRRRPNHGRRRRGPGRRRRRSTCRPPRPAPTASTSGSPGGTPSGSWTSSSRT